MEEGSGGGGGGGDFNIIIRWGEIKVNFCLVGGGGGLNVEPYFTHFPTLSPHPSNYSTVPNAENSSSWDSWWPPVRERTVMDQLSTMLSTDFEPYTLTE